MNRVSILILSVCTISGCENSNTSNTGTLFLDAPSNDIDPEIRNSELTVGSLQTLSIGPQKVECESYHLTECMLVTGANDTDPKLFYDVIEGFDYQWGFDYELLVSEETNAFGQRFELVDILEKSRNPSQDNFSYTARYAGESIVRISEGEYKLAGGSLMICDTDVCESLESSLIQNQSMLLNIGYGSQPGDPLELLTIECTAAQESFNTSCL